MKTSLLVILSIIGIAALMRDLPAIKYSRQQLLTPAAAGGAACTTPDGSGLLIRNEITNRYLSAY